MVMTNWEKFQKELHIAKQMLKEGAPNKDIMRQGLKLQNAELDLILSGEWKNENNKHLG